MSLVKEGFAASLTEAATRFAISHPAMGTILVGIATPQRVRGRAYCGPKRPAAARRTRSVVSAAPDILRRTTVIAELPTRDVGRSK